MKYQATAHVRALCASHLRRLGNGPSRRNAEALTAQFLAGPPESDPGAWLTYYCGPTPLGGARTLSLFLDAIAGFFGSLQRQGLAELQQRRTSNPVGWEYRARLSSIGRVPLEAQHGTVGSTSSAAYNGRAPAVNQDGSFAMPARADRQDGAGRPSLDAMEEPNAQNS